MGGTFSPSELLIILVIIFETLAESRGRFHESFFRMKELAAPARNFQSSQVPQEGRRGIETLDREKHLKGEGVGRREERDVRRTEEEKYLDEASDPKLGGLRAAYGDGQCPEKATQEDRRCR